MTAPAWTRPVGAPAHRSIAARAALVLAIVLWAAFLLVAAPVGAQGTAQPRADLVDLENEVMCVVCERPLSTSGGDAAEDQRAVIQDLIDEGLDKQQIKDRLVAEYGDKVLVKGSSPIAAAAPAAAILIGLASVWLLLRRRRAGRAGEPTGQADETSPADATEPTGASPAPAPAPSAEDEARIDAELAERG